MKNLTILSFLIALPLSLYSFSSNRSKARQKKQELKSKYRSWQKDIKREKRLIERSIRPIEREERKTKEKIKATMKRSNDKSIALPMVKALIYTKKEKFRLHKAAAQLGSFCNLLKTQLATQLLGEGIKKTSKVMKTMNNLIKVPELKEILKSMSKEMFTNGIIEEMVDDSFAALDPEELEEKAQEEVDQVLEEILGKQFEGVEVPHTKSPKGKTPEKLEREKQKAEAHAKLAAKLDAEDDLLSKKLETL